MALAAPRLIPAPPQTPREVAPDLWILERQLAMPGGPRLATRSTLIRTASGNLVVISPLPLDSSEAAQIAALGGVRDVVLPNSFHFLYAAEFLSRFPDARLHLAPGLRERVPDLPPGTVLEEGTPPQWAPDLEFTVLGPVRGASEVIFFHRPSGTVVLTDLAFNVVSHRVFNRIAWRLAGVPRGFGPSRTARMLLLRDREVARAALRRVAGWPMRRILVAHGEAVERDAPAEFQRAFARYL
jgi:hypothetical protein